MDVIEYSYKSSDLLLKELYKYTNDNKLKVLLEPFSKLDEKDIDISWSMISTALLMSENMLKGMPVLKKDENYNNYPIHDQTIALLLDHWYRSETEIFCALDENNNYSINLLYIIDYLNNPNKYKKNNLISKKEYESDYYDDEYIKYVYEVLNRNHNKEDDEYYKNEYTELVKSNYIVDELLKNMFKDDNTTDFGKYNEIYSKVFNLFPILTIKQDKVTNEPCIKGALNNKGEFDFRAFMFRVRCALAHSEYEPYSDYIHLYHKINATKKDFNVFLDKKSIILLLDDINETAHDFFYSDEIDSSIYASPDEKFNYIVKKHLELLEDRILSTEEIIKLIQNVTKIPKEKIQKIINGLINTSEWTNPIEDILEEERLGYEEYTKTDKIYYSNAHRINYVLRRIKYKDANLLTNLGIIINTYYNTNKDNSVSDDLDLKSNFYKYITDSYLFRTAFSSKKDKEFKDELCKILIISYLNAVLSTNYNVALNKESIFYGLEINFEGLKINKEVENYEKEKKRRKYQNLIQEIDNQIKATETGYKKIYKIRKNKIRNLKSGKIPDGKFKESLPTYIRYDRNTLKNLYNNRKELYESKKELVLEKENIDITLNNKDKTAYIIKSIRDAISHGYIDFDSNIIKYNTIVTIRDYDEDDDLTFEGEISIYDLLKIVIKNKDLLYSNKELNNLKTK